MLGNILGGDSHIGVSLDLSTAHTLWKKNFTDAASIIGWGKYMEWMYPVEVRITNKGAFRAAGAIEAAATL